MQRGGSQIIDRANAELDEVSEVLGVAARGSGQRVRANQRLSDASQLVSCLVRVGGILRRLAKQVEGRGRARAIEPH